MQRPPIAKLRRLALFGVVAMVVILGVSYGVRRWRAYRARVAVPTVAEDVQQQAEKFTFSRSEEGRTLFSVQASRTTERAGKTAVLENVVATIHGRRGDRADEVRSQRCEYDQEGSGEIYCPGEVTVQLGGPPRGEPSGQAGAPSAPGAYRLRLTTRGVHFDTAHGAAWTDQPVHFEFQQGAGDAVGVRYQSEEPAVRLEQQVAIRLGSAGKSPVEVRGAQLLFYSGEHTLELLPPLTLRSDERTLTADRLRVELDADFRTRRIEALGHVRAEGRQRDRQFTLLAPRAAAEYDTGGNLERLRASDGVRVTSHGPDTEETLTSQEAVVSFTGGGSEVERAVATGAAELVARAPKETRELRAPILEMVYPASERSAQVLTAGPRGTLVLKPTDGPERTLVADRIELRFRDQKRLEALAGSGKVETRTARATGQAQTTASDELRARFDADGRLAEGDQWGDFRYADGRWQARAGRAHYRADTETFLLNEEPAFWDSTTRTTADTLELSEKTGALRGEGNVRTTQQPRDPGGQPVHFASDRLRAERERNWARYEGQARMWEGENRLAANSIELFRDERKLVADGQVVGLFVEAPAAKAAAAAAAAAPAPPETPPAQPSAPAAPAPPKLVRVTSDHFTYLEAKRWGVFEGNVTARNDFGTMTAPHLEIFLAPGEARSSQSLERALAQGGVHITQPDGEASGEQAEYRADSRTVRLWGGEPKVTDPTRGTVTGAELTLFLADGSILVNSAEGTRTVTRRRWTR